MDGFVITSEPHKFYSIMNSKAVDDKSKDFFTVNVENCVRNVSLINNFFVKDLSVRIRTENKLNSLNKFSNCLNLFSIFFNIRTIYPVKHLYYTILRTQFMCTLGNWHTVELFLTSVVTVRKYFVRNIALPFIQILIQVNLYHYLMFHKILLKNIYYYYRNNKEMTRKTLNNIFLTKMNIGTYKYLLLSFALFDMLYSALDLICKPVCNLDEINGMHVYGSCFIVFCTSFLRENTYYGFIASINYYIKNITFRPYLIYLFSKPQYALIWFLIVFLFFLDWTLTCYFTLDPSNDLSEYLRESVWVVYEEPIEKLAYFGSCYGLVEVGYNLNAIIHGLMPWGVLASFL
uniref:TLC domain-containing protein n=1 Tax=Heterorhabditis bacteriophora TaxID=37862 RepID=A0A1I7X9S7_HETBA